MTEAEEEYRFKIPTNTNWLERDDVWDAFVPPCDMLEAPTTRYTCSLWLARAREPTLLTDVPIDIRRLFEVARSAIVYGYLRYPLLTLGTEQLYRVAEAAARLRAKELGWLPSKDMDRYRADLPNFILAIRYLKKQHQIKFGDRGWWDVVVSLRNHASHPTMQTIKVPGSALTALVGVAEKINGLYS